MSEVSVPVSGAVEETSPLQDSHKNEQLDSQLVSPELASPELVFLVLGIDPDTDALTHPHPNFDHFRELCLQHDTLLQLTSTQQLVRWLKPNLSFFLKWGWQGLQLLELQVAQWKRWGYKILLDAKFSEIDNSLKCSLDFAFGTLGADSVTVNPFLGEKTLQLALEKCAASNAQSVFVLCQTSQQSQSQLSHFQNEPKRLLQALTALESAHFSARSSKHGGTHSRQPRLGAVVGANHLNAFEAQGFTGPLLCPGLGAQGTTPSDLVKAPKNECFFPVSRGIFRGGLASPDEMQKNFAQFANSINGLKNTWKGMTP